MDESIRRPAATDGSDRGPLAEQARDLRGSLPEPLRRRFGRGLGEIARGRRRGRPAERLIAAARAEAERLERRAATPLRLDPPSDSLPIAAAWESLGATIASRRVVVVQGATGSGKSTQLPRLCAALGRGVAGRIAVTQPRRLAARAIAARLAEECGVELGGGVGWRTRFERREGPATRIEVMTDGVLAAGLGRDPRLLRYDTVIVDEAHERSVVIDLLLGSLKRAVEVREDLRVVVASATLAADRFARFFGGAPVVEIPGRQHPVEILHRPIAEEDSLETSDPDAPRLERAADAVDEALSRQAGEPGDVLVFLPTTRAIDDLAELLAGRLGGEVPLLPLHARLDASAQDAAFRRPAGPRVILATNVAETSLTLPWVRSVVDTGLARVRRYDPRRRIARLRVEPIARANAAQRAGRCGRVGPGTCIRLYSAEELSRRPEFMPPEILRTGLAGVMLELAHRNLPEVERFPWVDPPAAVRIEEARRTLRELGALEPDGHGGERLNEVAARLARLPLDPRLARIVDGGIEEGCLAEAIVVATSLAVPEIRAAPRAPDGGEGSPAIDPFRDARSDLLSILRIWRAWTGRAGESAGRRRRWCRRHGLRHLAMREWESTANQVASLIARSRRVRLATPIRLEDHCDAARIHRAALRGLIGTVAALAREEDREPDRDAASVSLRGGRMRNRHAAAAEGPYLTVDGVRASIWPGSTLARQTPRLVVAAELLETGRRWLRTIAPVRPSWVERFVPHLLVREHFSPRWIPETGQVAASERVRFGEVLLVRRREVPFGPIDPAAARQVFIQGGLVEGRLRTRGRFLERNRRLLERLAELDARTRRPRASLREEAVFEFYDRVLPDSIHSGPSFERWRRRAESRRPGILHIRPEDLAGERRLPDEREFPDELVLERVGAAPLSLPIRYRHDPGDPRDGLALELPVEAVELLDPQRIEWLVPGRLEEKVAAILRGLPKALRTRIHPMREVVAEVASALQRPERFGGGSLFEAIALEVERACRVPIEPAVLAASELEPSLRFLVELRDGDRTLEGTRDAAGLRGRWRDTAREGLERRADRDAALAPWTREAVHRLPEEALPLSVEVDLDGRRVEMHPALVPEGSRVALRLEARLDRALALTHLGLRRLLREAVAEAMEHHLEYHPRWPEVEETFPPEEGTSLADAVADLVCERAFRIDPRELREFRSFDARLAQGERDLYVPLDEVVSTLAEAGRSRRELCSRLESPTPQDWREAVAEVASRRARLDPRDPAFVPELLPGLPRYLAALGIRLDRLRTAGPERDRLDAAALSSFESRLASVEAGAFDARCRRLRVLVEELHVAIFADRLGTSRPISVARLERAFESEGLGAVETPS